MRRLIAAALAMTALALIPATAGAQTPADDLTAALDAYIAQKVTPLQDKVDALAAQVATLEAQNQQLSDSLSGFTSRLDALGVRVAALENRPPPPADTDGDGVADVDDQCPTQAGPASNHGCPVPPPPTDTDHDGVPDTQDACPNEAGPASNQGCPVPQPPPSGDCPVWPAFPTSGATAAGCTGFRHTNVPLTAYTGPSTISTAGTVIDGKDITSCLTINAPNVTVKRSYVHCGDGIVVNSTNFLVEDTELNGNGATGCDWLLGSNNSNTSLTGRRIYVHDCSDGFRVNGQFTLVDSYLGGLHNNSGDHNDGMQGYGPGGTAIVRHNYLDGRTQNRDGMNGVIFFADAWKGNVTIEQNFLAGGAYSLRLHESAHYWVNSNRVLAGSYNYGPVVNTAGGIIEQWTDNRLRNADGTDGAAFNP